MKTIAVTSGKGGVGKSTLSANLGVELANMGYRTVVFDADLALANLEVILGVRPEFTLQNVVTEDKTVLEVVKKCPSGVGLVAGGSGVPMLMRSGPKKLGMFFEQVQALEQTTDILIFDTSAGLENRVMAFAKFADEVLLVTTPDPTSMTDAYATIKTVFRQKPDASINLVVNMASSLKEAQGVFNILSTVTKDFTGHELGFAGCVRKDETVAKCARQRKLYVFAEKDSAAKTDTSTLAAILVEPTQSLRLAA